MSSLGVDAFIPSSSSSNSNNNNNITTTEEEGEKKDFTSQNPAYQV
jgi:hypothetical protein